METEKEIIDSGLYHKLHTAKQKGYVSRKSTGVVKPYQGKFGKGFIVLSPNWESTRYCFITYYIED